MLEWRYNFLMEMSGQLQTPAALHLRIYCIGGSVGPTAGLDAVEKILGFLEIERVPIPTELPEFYQPLIVSVNNLITFTLSRLETCV
jgi:hypothetical protein